MVVQQNFIVHIPPVRNELGTDFSVKTSAESLLSAEIAGNFLKILLPVHNVYIVKSIRFRD